jgi:YD repeat-containing protein
MLKTIKYPTGGETEFVYEGNRYDYAPYYQPPQNTSTLEGPGLRIKEVISKPGSGGKNIHKIYKYGVYEDGRGYLNRCLHPETAAYADLLVTESNTMHYWSYDFTLNGQGQGGYRTRDYFPDPYVKFDFSENVVKYDAVNEYYLEDDVPKQKTTSSYNWDYNDELINFNVTDREEFILHARKFSNPENGWRKPVLVNKAFYKYAKDQYNNDQYDLVKKESYDYSSPIYDDAWDMPTYLHTSFVWVRTTSTGSISNTDHYNEAKEYNDNHCSIYGYGYRHYTTSNQLVHHSLIEEYTPNGVIKTEKNFDYEPIYGILRSEELVNSKNELTKTTYSYPFDFPNVPVYQQMVQKNIVSPAIETITTVNGTQTKKTVTNFYSPYSNVFVPQSIENKTGNNLQEVVANFNRYDNLGHILEQQKTNNVKEVYLWGYQSRYPVAKILNTTYDIASAYITQSVLDGATGNGDDAAIRAHLNNLRNIPGALVETYTYKLFVGLTSSTDANGRTSYYEYDGFGRLVYIRDKDNNILKKYCYNYAGQPDNCSYNGNSAKSGTFLKQGCQTGYVGAPITYTVPANTYFGPNADALAQNEINANGQTYANQHGSCVIARYNIEKSGVFTKNNCGPRGIGSAVTYTVAANTYAAYSEDAANQLAQNDVDANGQSHANTQGYCTWYKVEKSGDFTKDNCNGNGFGTTVTYTVAADTYSSTTSPEHADQLAQDDVNQYGQSYANTYGDCVDNNAYLSFQNHSNHAVDVWLFNPTTDESHFITIYYNQSDIPLAVTAGTWEIHFMPDGMGSNDHYFYVVGCDYMGGGYGPYSFYGVQLGQGANCNLISIN